MAEGWIPAFAGMTGGSVVWNDGWECGVEWRHGPGLNRHYQLEGRHGPGLNRHYWPTRLTGVYTVQVSLGD